jgi:hypothetical protein
VGLTLVGAWALQRSVITAEMMTAMVFEIWPIPLVRLATMIFSNRTMLWGHPDSIPVAMTV